jgi:tRNA-dihydrouridine synthase B
VQEDGRRLAVSEMVTSNSLLYGSAKTQRRANHDGEVDPISVQIAGADPAMMAEAARHNVDAARRSSTSTWAARPRRSAT